MSTQPAAARELLEFYLEAGVDALVGEEPTDHLADTPPSPPVGTSPKSPLRVPETKSVSPATPPAPDVAALAAGEAVAAIASLDDLRAALDRFEGCALRSTATQLVFADGNPQARLM